MPANELDRRPGPSRRGALPALAVLLAAALPLAGARAQPPNLRGEPELAVQLRPLGRGAEAGPPSTRLAQSGVKPRGGSPGGGAGAGGDGQKGAIGKLDKNGDGKLSRAEWPKAEVFDAIDTDHDGFLTAAELQQSGARKAGAQQRVGGRPQTSPDTRAKNSDQGGPKAAIARLDKNGDGKLSRAEWPKAEVFEAIDTDRDGFLTAAELQRRGRSAGGARSESPARAQGGPGGGPPGQRLAKPTDRFLAGAESEEPSLTLEEAEKIVAEAGDQPLAALPPNIADITAILDAQPIADPDLAERLRAVARALPPGGASDAELAGFHRDRGLAAGRIGDSERERTDLRKAVELAERADPGQLAELLSLLAAAEQRTGAKGTVIALRERALDLATASPDRKSGGLRVRNLASLVGLYVGAGKIAAARGRMQQIDRFLDRSRSSAPMEMWRYQWVPQAMQATALLMQAQGRDEKAATLLRAAIKLVGEAARRGLDAEFETAFLDTLRRALANSYLRQGRIVEAEIEARGALLDTLARAGKYSSAAPAALLSLVVVLREQGRLREAGELATAAVDIMRTIGLEPASGTVVKARRTLASVKLHAGDVDGALEIYDGLAELSDSEGSGRQLLSDNDRLLALVLAGRHGEAIPALRAAIGQERAKKRLNTVRTGILAVALARAGDRAEARGLFDQSVPRLLAAADDQEDEDYVSETSKQFRIAAVLEGYLGFLADTAAEAGRGADRQALVAEALRIADGVGTRLVRNAVAASSARASVRDPELAELVRSEQDTRKRITALNALLAGILASPSDQQDEDAVAELRDSVETLRAAAVSLEAEIQRTFPDYAALLNPTPPTIEALRAVLADDEAYVSVHLGRERTYVWAVRRQGDVAFAATPLARDHAEKLVAALRDALDPQVDTLGAIPDFDVRLAYQLYERTLGALAPAWWSAKSLLVSVNGPLDQLPLAVLPTRKVRLGDGEGPLFANYRDIPWLARSHATTLVPSSATLATLRTTPAGRPERKPFIGFGDPYFNAEQAAEAAVSAAAPAARIVAADGGQGFRSRGLRLALRAAPRPADAATPELSALPRLPDTADEVSGMAIALRADPSQSVRLGLGATEAAVKETRLSDYRVVAFATHGLVPGDLSGLREPALALSAPDISDTDGDGLLTMTEIMGLRLDADWVILSACNTGTGRGAGAEAVSGLGRAFFYAGTRALLVSSWPVETVSARLLTTDLFARQRENPDIGRAEALRQAVSALIDRPGPADPATGETLFYYAHPIFWAPFVLVGDGGSEAPNAEDL